MATAPGSFGGVRFGLEATGHYGHALQHFLLARGAAVGKLREQLAVVRTRQPCSISHNCHGGKADGVFGRDTYGVQA